MGESGHRIGPPLFLGSILISWGLVATLFAWMKTSAQFYMLRFILGLAESGAYPGESLCHCFPIGDFKVSIKGS